MQLTCRFYKNQFPDTDDVVMVNVSEIEEMGVYVNLLEYNNRQGSMIYTIRLYPIVFSCLGMILLTELSNRRIRSINRLIRVGRNEVVVVIRADGEKGLLNFIERISRNDQFDLRLYRFIKTSSIS